MLQPPRLGLAYMYNLTYSSYKLGSSSHLSMQNSKKLRSRDKRKKKEIMDSKIFIPSNALALLLTFLLCISNMQTSLADTTTTTKNSSETYTDYLKKVCNSTLYSQLCIESLSPYTSTIKTNDLKLCTTALTLTLKAASNTSKLVESLSKESNLSKTEAGIIKDCIDEMRDSIDELKQSLNALDSLNGSADIKFQISNIKTWMSAAITDEDTCTDGFYERKISDEVMRKIRETIVNVAMLTSNALALINILPY